MNFSTQERIAGWLMANGKCREATAHEYGQLWVNIEPNADKRKVWFRLGYWNPSVVQQIMSRGVTLKEIRNSSFTPDIIEKFNKGYMSVDRLTLYLLG